jgi:hypothetical protein
MSPHLAPSDQLTHAHRLAVICQIAVAATCGVAAFFLAELDYYNNPVDYPKTYLSSPLWPVFMCVLIGFFVAEVRGWVEREGEGEGGRYLEREARDRGRQPWVCWMRWFGGHAQARMVVLSVRSPRATPFGRTQVGSCTAARAACAPTCTTRTNPLSHTRTIPAPQVFLSVYELAIDTIFLCFCDDCDAHNGQPQLAPPILLDAMGVDDPSRASTPVVKNNQTLPIKA